MNIKFLSLTLTVLLIGAFGSFATESSKKENVSIKSAKLCFEIKNSRNLNNISFGKWTQYENVNIQKDGVIFCDNTVKVAKRVGVRQYINLNQSRPMPITFSAESKCESSEKEGGKPTYKYSIYLDIFYTDGTCTRAVIAPFNIGTHDWEKAERTYTPEKPIKRLHYILFYMRPGKAWFRNVSLTAIQPGRKGEIFINGQKVGEVPAKEGEEYKEVSLAIPNEQLSALATVNIVNIENSPKGEDLFTIRNVYLKAVDTNGNIIKSNIAEGPFTSFKTGIVDLGNGKKRSLYQGAPLPEINLTLPTKELGELKPPFFERKTGELYRDNSPKKWLGLSEAALDGSKRTMCDIRPHEFIAWPKEYILDMQRRNNSDILLTSYSKKLLDKQDSKMKMQFLRSHGIKISLMFGSGSLRDPYMRLPESAAYNEFFANLSRWAPLIDIAGMDEWFLSPAILKTDGGHITPITEKFIAAFAKYSGYSLEDAKWGFVNHKSDDPRTIKAWEFCDKVQNDLARKFVSVAKKANPKVKTWVSYITRNWNKSVTCIDSAINDFDEILQCQTYWYGRGSKDPLNSSLITASIGMGKIFKAEYPNKFLWMGIDPGYSGGKNTKVKGATWGTKLYGNSPEEVVPYLALLYAVSDGVFIQSSGGGVWLLQDSPKIDGAYVDNFADVTRLVSKLVPFIKSYKKSDIAYYYDPDADWEITRRIYRFIAARQTNEIAVGLLQQFCDVDVTKDVSKYKNVIYAGLLLPAKFNYTKQNIYLMYAPMYNEKGNKIPEEQLFEKLSLKDFEQMCRNFFPSDEYNENGSKDMFKISNMGNLTRATGKTIKGAIYPTRMASSQNTSNQNYIIGAKNKAGNVLVNSLWPSFITQDLAEKTIKTDLEYFKWTKRDCPQVNGTDKIVAVAFREARTAVLDFDNDFTKVKIVVFNGRDGVTCNKTVKYIKNMKIKLPPLNVLVATGVK